jgi:transposase
MLQITPQMRVLVAVEAVDGRKGIDSLAQQCRQQLGDDPFSGCMFVFRTRSGQTLKVLVYDGTGFWMAQKRLSKGRFKWWPEGGTVQALEAHQLQVLFAGGDPKAPGAPVWRPVRAERKVAS